MTILPFSPGFLCLLVFSTFAPSLLPTNISIFIIPQHLFHIHLKNLLVESYKSEQDTMAAAMAAACCGLEEETVTGEQKAPGACPRCGGAVVATDVESARRVLCCLPLCVKNKRKFSCARCRRSLAALYTHA
ncbi:unnamed protein product [Urochloa decumbens]|uniref:Uncharacterized protein n=1 Tax=Urochloa decumbens TaxID=240449 RepID=A0ABC9BC76_9POAL